MTNEIPKTNYAGIEISYNERCDKWVFELRGKERSSGTLTLAKEAIDKPTPKDKSDSFTPIDAILYTFGGYRPCRVTSLAEVTYGAKNVWVFCDGRRSKEPETKLFENTVANRNAVAAIDDLTQKAQKLREQAGRINLSPMVWPKTP